MAPCKSPKILENMIQIRLTRKKKNSIKAVKIMIFIQIVNIFSILIPLWSVTGFATTKTLKVEEITPPGKRKRLTRKAVGPEKKRRKNISKDVLKNKIVKAMSSYTAVFERYNLPKSIMLSSSVLRRLSHHCPEDLAQKMHQLENDSGQTPGMELLFLLSDHEESSRERWTQVLQSLFSKKMDMSDRNRITNALLAYQRTDMTYLQNLSAVHRSDLFQRAFFFDDLLACERSKLISALVYADLVYFPELKKVVTCFSKYQDILLPQGMRKSYKAQVMMSLLRGGFIYPERVQAFAEGVKSHFSYLFSVPIQEHDLEGETYAAILSFLAEMNLTSRPELVDLDSLVKRFDAKDTLLIVSILYERKIDSPAILESLRKLTSRMTNGYEVINLIYKYDLKSCPG